MRTAELFLEGAIEVTMHEIDRFYHFLTKTGRITP